MARLIFLIICAVCAIIPPILGQCTVNRASKLFKRSVYDFSLNLMTRITQDTENHFITSTLSVWSIIASISLGADDVTLTEIKRVLRMHPHKCFNNKYFELTKSITKSTDKEIILEKSSTLFFDERMSLKDEFKNKISSTGICNVQGLPFNNFALTSTIINEYVSRATHEAIDEIVSSSDLENVFLILIDAIYFKGKWKLPFSTADTELSAFYDENNNQLGDVNLMFVSGKFNFTMIRQINAHVLELPYGDGSRFSMLVFLPTGNKPVISVLDSLHSISLDTIFNIFANEEATTVQVQIPRFKITSDLDNLKELLNDMGIKSMFDTTAHFPHISNYALYISNFIQKADIEVTEEGTVASAVTEMELEDRMMPPQFTATKPFLFMIVDKAVDVPLFTGIYSKPSIF